MIVRCVFALTSRTARGTRRRVLYTWLPTLILAVLLTQAACRATSPDPKPPVAPAPTVSAVDEEPEPPAVDCGEAIEGADEVLRPGGLVMLGEMHGTRQIPAFTADLVCLGAARGLPVRLGVELPLGEQAAIDTYLAAPATPATPADRDALLSSDLWTRPDQDGRSSEAMLALIERVRTLRQAGLDVTLFSFDIENRGDWNARDARMAALILERASAEPQALVITLSGNVHNRITPGLPWSADAVPMGVIVHRARPDAISLDARYQEGTAWVCLSGTGCGVARLRGSTDSPERRLVMQTEPDANGYHGTFSVGAIEAAPPAVAPSPS